MSGPLIYRRGLFGAEWLPTDEANLVAWYDFADSSSLTLSGSDITAVSDKSGNGFNLSIVGTSGAFPQLQGNVKNGKSAAYFAAARTLRNTSVDIEQPNTIYAVFKVEGSASANQYVYGGASGTTNRNSFLQLNTNRGYLVVATSVLNTGIAINNTWQISSNLFSGTSTKWQLNANSGTGGLPTNKNTGIVLGADIDGSSSRLTGYICEVIYYNADKWSIKDTIISYLNDKWAIY
jgi:hypothetical protein